MFKNIKKDLIAPQILNGSVLLSPLFWPLQIMRYHQKTKQKQTECSDI